MRCNYRHVADRFTHIDAEFVACSLGFPEKRPFFRVRFYPWWEHPQYVDAIAAGEPWGFAGSSAGVREVTVYPLGLIAFSISRATTVTDWFFADTGRYLWGHEPDGQIFLNGAVDRDELVCAVDQRLHVGRPFLRTILAPPGGSAWVPPFSMRLPRSVLLATREALDERSVPYYAAFEPAPPKDLPVALVIDDGDYIIARDFELDVPDFDHRPEWFRPGVR